ncbi:hypothetical protein [Rhizobium laguerreae]|uniref:Cj0069 family protein n=1 Tax=Rhizobium laguerreae TaxID=1076926 RepID=UPI003CCE5479
MCLDLAHLGQAEHRADADFLYGPPDASGNDTYVLCEINVSSVFAVPDDAPTAIARAMAMRLHRPAP